MSEIKVKGQLRFQTTRPLDKTDPGFRILGHKLRWVAANQTEDKMGRIWKILRKSELPPEFLKSMSDANRDVFNGDGTIRNRELVLAYAPEDVVLETRKELKEAAARQLNLVTSRAVPGGNKHMKVDHAELTKEASSEFFNE